MLTYFILPLLLKNRETPSPLSAMSAISSADGIFFMDFFHTVSPPAGLISKVLQHAGDRYALCSVRNLYPQGNIRHFF